MTGKALLAILLAVVLVAVVIAAVANQVTIPNEGQIAFPLTITADNETYGNGTVLQWDELLPGNTASKNFTVTNIANANYTVTIYADPPENTLMTWAGNNTLLEPQQKVSEWLNWTATVYADAGTYNWNVTVVATVT